MHTKMERRSGAKRPRCDPYDARFVYISFVPREELQIPVSSQMLKQLTMDDRNPTFPPSPPPVCEAPPPPPPGYNPDNRNPAEWWKWVGNPSSDPTEEPSDLEEDESDEENEDGEDEDEVEEEEFEIDPDEPPYLPEGNGFDEDYISDSDSAMADGEDDGESLERGIISTSRDGKVANPDWYKSRLT